jgi:uncharacterized membrane protein (DUF485 family)
LIHGPSHQWKDDPSIGFKMRLGVLMFLLYALVYAGFVALNVLKPVLMEKPFLGGMNVAVTYGFGLILLALLLAFIYDAICRSRENRPSAANPKKESA